MKALARLAAAAACLASVLTTAFAQTTPAPADRATRAQSQAVQEAQPAVREAPVAAARAPAPATAAGTLPAAPGKKPPTTARSGPVADKLDLDTTQITGNRELPKVMVVVPWKRSDIGDLVGRPVNSLVDEVLQPVDREVFRREIDYYGALTPDRPRDETHVTGGAVKERPEK